MFMTINLTVGIIYYEKLVFDTFCVPFLYTKIFEPTFLIITTNASKLNLKYSKIYDQAFYEKTVEFCYERHIMYRCQQLEIAEYWLQ